MSGQNGHKPRLLDLYCCEGGAGMGYSRAGFEVVGVDVKPQPRYPFEFVRADVLSLSVEFLRGFDAIHASPPCQRYSKAQRLQGREHPDLIEPTRAKLRAVGRPYIIENVEGSPLLAPITLCGAMFGLRTYRHRIFETSWLALAPGHPPHTAPLRKMGRPIRDGEFMHIVGNFSGVAQAKAIMDMPWADRDGLREAIPPAYTEWLGKQLLAHLQPQRVAA